MLGFQPLLIWTDRLPQIFEEQQVGTQQDPNCNLRIYSLQHKQVFGCSKYSRLFALTWLKRGFRVGCLCTGPFIKNQQPLCHLSFHHLIPSVLVVYLFWKCSCFWFKSSQIAIKCVNVASLNCLINLDYTDWVYRHPFPFLSASETLSIQRREAADDMQHSCQTSFSFQISVKIKC